MAYYSTEILEEGLKIAVHQDWFPKFEYKILGRVDFCICRGEKNFLWAEAKKGVKHEIEESFVQLIFTIKKDNTYGNYLPPKYLGAFDAEKIAFLEYGRVKDFFTMNDFDWTVTPSDHSTREFKLLYDRIVDVLKSERLQFDYAQDEDELREFIENIDDAQGYEIEVDENNIMFVFNKWCNAVKEKIKVKNWDKLKEAGVTEAEFFLADLLSYNNTTLEIYENLEIILKQTYYKLPDQEDAMGFTNERKVSFKEGGLEAHDQFWNKYKRPPEDVFQKYILNRRDLLVPFDVRERQGAFFTPPEWVELSQHYLAKELGRDWQDKYYVWDCCAGTGNMLFGLRNSERVFASTLSPNDVNIMHQNIRSGARLLDKHVFQFDFLNWDFNHPNVPEKLQDIIKNEPEKLVVYINPPYAETATKRLSEKGRLNKRGVSFTEVHKKYSEKIGIATKELFAQFLIRIYFEIPGCIIANFSTLKGLQGPNFKEFRDVFQPKLKSLFLVPANTFDNVKGDFPIGFFVWDAKEKTPFKKKNADVYDHKGISLNKKRVSVFKGKSLNKWIIQTRDRKNEEKLAFMAAYGNDFQHINYNYIVNQKSKLPNPRGTWMTTQNFIEISIYFAVRHCIPATWINDRDQFLYPKDSWMTDREFHNDCLAYTLFHGQNRISSTQGINHLIPFKEIDVRAKDSYKSRFLLDYLDGKIQQQQNQIFLAEQKKSKPVVFSAEAQRVMDCGKDLFRYYHQQDGSNADVSIYDIRVRFQGADEKGRMNSGSGNETYNGLLQNLRDAQKVLSKKIERKVYEHGFLEE